MTRAAKDDDRGCIFCEKHGRNDELIVFTGASCFVILNLYPYNNGHLMAVPKRHIANLASTTAEDSTPSRSGTTTARSVDHVSGGPSSATTPRAWLVSPYCFSRHQP